MVLAYDGALLRDVDAKMSGGCLDAAIKAARFGVPDASLRHWTTDSV